MHLSKKEKSNNNNNNKNEYMCIGKDSFSPAQVLNCFYSHDCNNFDNFSFSLRACVDFFRTGRYDYLGNLVELTLTL